jgi:hypothetical protein
MRIFVDGKPGPQLSSSTDARQLTPQRADLTSFLSPGKQSIGIRGGPSTHASAYLNASYYLPWTGPAVTGALVCNAESLRYLVEFDHTMITSGDSIHCTVHAERVGFRGYGMMLAEVGLPPGADVDRGSLDAALSSSREVQSYEIQPDRVCRVPMASCRGHHFFLFAEGEIRDEGTVRRIRSLRLLQSKSTSLRTAHQVCGEVKLKCL